MFEDFIELVRRPFKALTAIDARRRLPDGLRALGLSVALPAAASEIAGLGPFRPPANLGSLPSLTAEGVDIYARWVYERRFLLPLIGIGVSLGLWLAAAGVIHLVARGLGGQGDFAGYLKLAGYAALLGLVALPVLTLDALFKLAGNARGELAVGQLAGVVGIGIFLWQNALLIIAARDHYHVSMERAVTAVIGPIGCVAVLIVALGIVATVLLVLAQQEPTGL